MMPASATPAAASVVRATPPDRTSSTWLLSLISSIKSFVDPSVDAVVASSSGLADGSQFRQVDRVKLGTWHLVRSGKLTARPEEPDWYRTRHNGWDEREQASAAPQNPPSDASVAVLNEPAASSLNHSSDVHHTAERETVPTSARDPPAVKLVSNGG